MWFARPAALLHPLLAVLFVAGCADGYESSSKVAGHARSLDVRSAGWTPSTDAERSLTPLHEAIGTPDDWARAPRYLRFNFRIQFNGEEFLTSQNLWDRWEGRYRTRWSAEFQEGEVLGIVDMDTGEGRVWLNGEPAPEEAREQLVAAATYRALNDSYWLVAPHKLVDAGSRLAVDGPVAGDGSGLRRLHMTFADSVGQSPGDQFWLYLNPDTGMLDRWAFFLESFEGDASIDQASEWTWHDWTRFGDVSLALSRQMTSSPTTPQFTSGRIDFSEVRFLDVVDEAVFNDPATSLP